LENRYGPRPVRPANGDNLTEFYHSVDRARLGEHLSRTRNANKTRPRTAALHVTDFCSVYTSTPIQTEISSAQTANGRRIDNSGLFLESLALFIFVVSRPSANFRTNSCFALVFPVCRLTVKSDVGTLRKTPERPSRSQSSRWTGTSLCGRHIRRKSAVSPRRLLRFLQIIRAI